MALPHMAERNAFEAAKESGEPTFRTQALAPKEFRLVEGKGLREGHAG
jgi:hypothetical protein